MELVLISTAGSVDDGKSTLIGRLLYDTNSLPDDKIEAIRRSSRKMGGKQLDLSLATDGLMAERTQGITIDVAHVYFSTSRRRYIIADAPGHIEYTRNMVTGASNAQSSLVLIDVRNGVGEQTHRHFFISNLIRIKDIVVVVNKMDLVRYSRNAFETVKREVEILAAKHLHPETRVRYVPTSALYGDNVVTTSSEMTWYDGDTVLGYLESLPASGGIANGAMRFPVQTILKTIDSAGQSSRRYAGKVYGGTLQKGDEVVVLPTKQKTRIRALYDYDTQYDCAPSNSSVTVELEDDLSVSRGHVLVKHAEMPKESSCIRAHLCWMDTTPLVKRKMYELRHNTSSVVAKVEEIEYGMRSNFSGTYNTECLHLNEIGSLRITTNMALHYDVYADHKTNGSFILIDPATNGTVAVGMIVE